MVMKNLAFSHSSCYSSILTLISYSKVKIMTSIHKLDVGMSQVCKMRNSLVRKGLLSHLQFRSYVVLEELTSSK